MNSVHSQVIERLRNSLKVAPNFINKDEAGKAVDFLVERIESDLVDNGIKLTKRDQLWLNATRFPGSSLSCLEVFSSVLPDISFVHLNQ